MEIELRKILEYKDVFDDEPIDVFEVIKKYNRDFIIKGVCVLGHSYGNASLKKNTFFSSNSSNHIPQLYDRIAKALRRIGVNDICFSTIRTSLELLRITFSIPPNEFRDTGLKEDFEYDIFRVILKLNQNLFFL